MDKYIFLLLIFSGQRISDLDQLVPNNLKDGAIRIVQTKTKTNVSIPIRPEIEKIWFKNGGNIKRMSDQTLNRKLKEIAKHVTGLNNEEKKILTSKVGRMTIGTIMYREGQSLGDIMAITGHKTEEALRTYLDIDYIIAMNRINDTWDKVLGV